MAPASDELIAGHRVKGRYEIRGVLGRGGFGRVYRAMDVELEREVAIKVLELTGVADKAEALEALLARFRREAMLAARIHHPSVVRVYDVGVLEGKAGQPFIVMELLDGQDLEALLREGGPLEPARALSLFCGALDALAEAHQVGIVHKDLKPSNLFISTPGTPGERIKIVDFGIAHIGDASQGRLTQTGHMLGTPQYMAPEYFESQDVTPALDVYQMGLILVEMMWGRPVVDQDTPIKCIMAHVRGELAVPSALLEGPLGVAITRALAVDPGARFLNAGQFAEALRHVDTARLLAIAPHDSGRRPSGEAVSAHAATIEMPASIVANVVKATVTAQPSVRPADTMLAPTGQSHRLAYALGAALLAALLALAATVGLLVVSSMQVAPASESLMLASPVRAAAGPGAQGIHIDSVPPGARIYRGKDELGAAPVFIDQTELSKRRGRGKDKGLKLTARHRGYEDSEIELKAESSVDLVIRLRPEK